MQTYFVRHTEKLSIDPDLLRNMMNQAKIVIHFPNDKYGLRQKKDNDSLDPRDYAGYEARAISTFLELSQMGGYVCAQYFVGENQCLVGFVEPGTKIELTKGKWRDEPRQAIYKSLQLQKVRTIDESKLATVLLGRPQQGTISRWKNVGSRIAYLVDRKKLRPLLENLLPSQLEILCSELMRLPVAERIGLPRIAHLLTPVGRTMKDIDLFAISSTGQRIHAQVTFYEFGRKETIMKLEKLSKYSDNNKNTLVLFCNCVFPKEVDGILVFPVQQAFDVFTTTNTGKVWLKNIFDLYVLEFKSFQLASSHPPPSASARATLSSPPQSTPRNRPTPARG